MPIAPEPHLVPNVDEVVEGVTANAAAVKDNLGDVQETLAETVKSVEKLILDGFESVRAEVKSLFDYRAERLEQGQQYLSDRIKERPLTAILASLGVGFILGLLTANRKN